jgi:hypothetical protein
MIYLFTEKAKSIYTNTLSMIFHYYYNSIDGDYYYIVRNSDVSEHFKVKIVNISGGNYGGNYTNMDISEFIIPEKQEIYVGRKNQENLVLMDIKKFEITLNKLL